MVNISELEKKHPWNVITENDFKQRIQEIFDLLADTVSKTAGPYGSSTMIEEMGSYHMTKDGFTVIKNVHFNNRTDNTILNMLLSISHQMVMKVGDGSTTAIIAAYAFLGFLREEKEFWKYRPKEITEAIQIFIDYLCKVIQNNATRIPEDEYVDIMTKIARIATNDNKTYTEFIREIYAQSGRDTTISKRMSPNDKASYQILNDMFFIQGRYIDRVYCNSDNGAKCVLRDPLVLLFDFTLGNEHWDIVKTALRYMMDNHPGRRMLVIAPNYDQYFIDHVKSDVTDFITAYQQQTSGGAIPFPMVFAKNPFFKSAEKKIYQDLPPFLGNSMITPLVGEEFMKMIREYYKTASEYQQAINRVHQCQNDLQAGKATKEDLDAVVKFVPSDDGSKLLNTIKEKVGTYFGSCETVTIGDEQIEFSGFTSKNQSLIDIHIIDAKDEFEKELSDVENIRYVKKEYLDAKERLARIACKSAMIYVGGNTDLEKKLNDDSLDDAIKACQSASMYGYNTGNNLAILRAVEEAEKNEEFQSPIYQTLAKVLIQAIERVILTIYKNADPDATIETVWEKINYSRNHDWVCYDLNTGIYSHDIINSCRTDIEILKGAISIVGIILSANQYLSIEVGDKK